MDDNVSSANSTVAAERQAKTKSGGKNTYIYVGIAIIVIVAIVAIYALSSSVSGASVVPGDNVSVYYTGKFVNGTVFSTNVGGAPFNFTVGAGETITGFNNAVMGMKVGENKTVTLPPSEAYGAVNQSLIVAVPITDFGNQTLKQGMAIKTSSGLTGGIIGINATTVIVDFNPPLAGDTLVFQIHLVSIRK
ncbi:MAG: peptidylprolyl isomerase [Candidatus Marsarchaeota archaeon]|jgi:FKBP-type peptidyl-prolyl cis-trans isomerase 2|nr:peptidylprolyl isomerase [Candidatus Marsarchaeota archaeon]MCL5419205.1 peptidylprolyl isomerase [Candidatus Marsarchaeota archaeon]